MKIAPAQGPVFQLSQFFFLYAGLLNDTLFIRISLILAQFCIALWTSLGFAIWPSIANAKAEAIHLDSLLWAGSCIIVAALPLIRQLYAGYSRVTFNVGSYEEEAEALWRDWFRRCGICRGGFKKILDAAEWIQMGPGEDLTMQLDHERANDPENTYGDAFYFVVGGQLECVAHYKEGPREFTAHSGCFADAFPLLAALGQPTSAMAMQMGPLAVKVSEESDYTLISAELHAIEVTPELELDASPKPDHHIGADVFRAQGALLLRWRRSKLLEAVSGSNFTQRALSQLVTQSTLDGLFRASLPASPKERYDVIHRVRRRLNAAPLPLVTSSTRLQWWLAHVSLRELWRPGPEQRGMNTPSLGSREAIVADRRRSSLLASTNLSELDQIPSEPSPRVYRDV